MIEDIDLSNLIIKLLFDPGGRKRARELSSQSNTNTNASPSTDSDGTQPARTSAELMTIFASKKIKTDLMVVYNGLMNTAGYNTEKAKIHTNELAKFLLLKALDSDLDDTSLSPSPNIEEVWRTFMSVPQVFHLDNLLSHHNL